MWNRSGTLQDMHDQENTLSLSRKRTTEIWLYEFEHLWTLTKQTMSLKCALHRVHEILKRSVRKRFSHETDQLVPSLL